MNIAFVLVLVLPIASWAESDFFSSPCGKAIIESESGLTDSMSSEKIACLLANEEFRQAQVELCDGSESSLELARYLEYQRARKSAFEELRRARSQIDRVTLSQEISRIEQDWSLLGFRTEVSAKLSLVWSAEYACRPESQR